ncbi:EamA family transporter [Streptomyces tsukubensis]|uniref:EamA family transporter n=1 Tax=Streptomyces tsukubensis TaxID=83656 RepID=UPI00098FC0F7|nr:EamA family transporter [Streptomyces tsukubensis]QFR92434.1 EamA family transporter [Streptomyces tsukubensis]
MTALFALATSLLLGLSDFGGGILARRLPALTVVVVSQCLAALVLGVMVLATGAWGEADPRLWFAVGAGFVGPVAMLVFYQALSRGPMGVVSPLSSLGVVVPMSVGLALGERPGLWQYMGITVAIVGIVLAGGPEPHGAPVRRMAVGLTLLAALGFGGVMALISEASTTVTGLLLALFVQRCTNVLAGGAILWVSARRGHSVLPDLGPCPDVDPTPDATTPDHAEWATASAAGAAAPWADVTPPSGPSAGTGAGTGTGTTSTAVLPPLNDARAAGLRMLGRALPALTFVGLTDVAANGTYVLATQYGPVIVAAVLASLYPVVTAVAARCVLGERLRTVQAAGSALALLGTVLLAAG